MQLQKPCNPDVIDLISDDGEEDGQPVGTASPSKRQRVHGPQEGGNSPGPLHSQQAKHPKQLDQQDPHAPKPHQLGQQAHAPNCDKAGPGQFEPGLPHQHPGVAGKMNQPPTSKLHARKSTGGSLSREPSPSAVHTTTPAAQHPHTLAAQNPATTSANPPSMSLPCSSQHATSAHEAARKVSTSAARRPQAHVPLEMRALLNSLPSQAAAAAADGGQAAAGSRHKRPGLRARPPLSHHHHARKPPPKQCSLGPPGTKAPGSSNNSGNGGTRCVSDFARKWAKRRVPERQAQSGCMWVLGQHLHPGAAAYFLAARDAYLAVLEHRGLADVAWSEAGVKLFQVAAPPKSKASKELRRVACDLEEVVVALVSRSLDKGEPSVREVVMGLPPDIPVSHKLQMYHVGQDDPRVDLRGQLGIRCTADLEPGELLGPYTGDQMFNYEWRKFVKSPRPDYMPEGPEELRAAMWELDLNHYAIDIDEDIFCVLEGAERIGHQLQHHDRKLCHLVTSAFPCGVPHPPAWSRASGHSPGNELALVNDPTLDPLNPDQHSPALDDNPRGNCNIAEVVLLALPPEKQWGGQAAVGGWCVPVMEVTQAVQAGSDLRYPYGEQFW